VKLLWIKRSEVRYGEVVVDESVIDLIPRVIDYIVAI